MQTMSDRLFIRFARVVTGLLVAILFVSGDDSTAQQSAPPSQAVIAQASLTEVVRSLPEYTQAEKQSAYLGAIENATVGERDSALPKLMQWLEDERPRVRGVALLSLNLLYIPSDKRPGRPYSTSLPVQYIPAVAARLRDPDPTVRKIAFAALQSVEYNGAGMDELTKLVVPMLREADVVTEYPDPFFVESEQRMLAGMTPEQQAQFKAQPHKIIKLPAEGAGLLGILAMQTRRPSAAVDDAMIAFLDREDQTKTTLGDCLHTLALSSASERVNDEALRRVFEQKAMTIFLLQFVADLRLTPEQLEVQKERLLALSNDESAHPALRRSAKDVAACWNGERTGLCKPNDKDLSEQLDTR
jgi:hypothetical protein